MKEFFNNALKVIATIYVVGVAIGIGFILVYMTLNPLWEAVR